MGGVIFVIIVIAVVFSALKNSGSHGSRGRQTSSEENTTSTQQSYYGKDAYGRPQTSHRTSANTAKRKDTSMKSRANSADSYSYGTGTAGSYATRKATERAVDNMTELEYKSRPSAQEFRKMAGVEVDDGAILSAAKMHSLAAELGNEFDSKEDLMAPVFDLMVTGPDTSIPNERDFVSEGMDIINSYTLES